MLVRNKRKCRHITNEFGQFVKGGAGFHGMTDEWNTWYYAPRERKIRSFITKKMYISYAEMRKWERLFLKYGKHISCTEESLIEMAKELREGRKLRKIRRRHFDGGLALSVPFLEKKKRSKNKVKKPKTGVVTRGNK